jgi:cytochrome c2
MRLVVLLFAAQMIYPQQADSVRGRQLFESLSCVQCHGMNGKGLSIGPDLGRVMNRGFTPTMLAATMWNHAPAMWAAMRERDIQAGDLNEQAAADLFAYFYSVRFFEAPGDAARGKRAFATGGCEGCHALPVSNWDSLTDPIKLTEAMWNHVALGQKPLVARELTDILVYLRRSTSQPPVFQLGAGTSGEAIFQSKGCAGCHHAALKLNSLTDLAAAMWNHGPTLAKATATPAKFAPGEMKELIGYLWTRQLFEDTGSATAGRKVFVSKQCAGCHDSGSAPKLRKSLSAPAMVSALWRHGPSMLSQMKTQRVAWPRFEGSQMADLIAYLNSRKSL